MKYGSVDANMYIIHYNCHFVLEATQIHSYNYVNSMKLAK